MSSNNTAASCYFLPVVHLDYSRSNLVANFITSALNSLLSLTAVCGNAFVIYIIWKLEALHVPSNALLCCLAVSDLVVGLISQPSFVIYKVAEISGYFDVYCDARLVQSCSGWITVSVSLLTLCAISVDRYLALKLHLRYAAVVTVTHILRVVLAFWILCTTGIAIRFVMIESHWKILVFVSLFNTVFVTVMAYFQLFRIVLRHRRQIKERCELAAHFHGRSPVEVARHQKNAVNMLYILGAFLLCFVPFLCVLLAESACGYTLPVKIAYDYSTTVAYISSSLNPVLYFWRIRELRRAAVRTLHRVKKIILR